MDAICGLDHKSNCQQSLLHNNGLFPCSTRQSCPNFLPQGSTNHDHHHHIQNNWDSFVALKNYGCIPIPNSDVLQMESIVPVQSYDSRVTSIVRFHTSQKDSESSSSSTACGKQNMLLDRLNQQHQSTTSTIPQRQYTSSCSNIQTNRDNNLRQQMITPWLNVSNPVVSSNVNHTTHSEDATHFQERQKPLSNVMDIDNLNDDDEENSKLFDRLVEITTPFLQRDSNNDDTTSLSESITSKFYEPNPM
jgi:hypothetical protein